MAEPRLTEQQCIESAGEVLAASDAAIAQMTPREQAEAAWSPTSRLSVDELEDEIRVDRGLEPVHVDRETYEAALVARAEALAGVESRREARRRRDEQR